MDTLYERVKGEWEERFEGKYGFWRGLTGEGAPIEVQLTDFAA